MRQASTALISILLCLTGKAQIVINELGIAPSAGSPEFIELYNRSSCSVDLSCYTIVFSGTSASGNATGWTVKMPSGKSIFACDYFLIGGVAGAAGVTAGTGFPTGGVVTSYPSADLDIGTASITANAVYMKQGVNAGTLPNSSGQITLLNSGGIVVASVSYNNGNNSGSYPLSAYTDCAVSGNKKGINNIVNPGNSANNVNAVFSSSGTQGIYLDASGNYIVSTTLSPGASNPSQINCAPAIIISSKADDVCSGSNDQTTTLTYSSTINSPTHYSITWEAIPSNSFTNVINASLPPNSITINVPARTQTGTYTGHIVVSNAWGTSCSTPFIVTVKPTPLVNAGTYIAVCSGSNPLILKGYPDGGTFTGEHVSGNIFIPPLTSGNYAVNYLYTDPATNCTDSASTIIEVNPLPVITISSDTVICSGHSIILNASANNAEIQWLGIGQTNAIKITPSSTVVYTAVATSANGCTDTAKTIVTVDDFKLQLYANPNPALSGMSVHLQTKATSSYKIIKWYPEYLFSDHSAFTQRLVADTSLVVSVLSKSATGCMDSTTINIIIDTLPSEIFIPTAFTPNGDGKNDVFRIFGGNIQSFDLKILNRWGQVIFSSNNKWKFWDGNLNGRLQLTGSYVYILKAVLKNGSAITKKGTILLIR